MQTHTAYLGSGQWGLFLPSQTIPAFVSSDPDRLEVAAKLLEKSDEREK